MDYEKIDNVFLAGIDTTDYPDFSDAYIKAADYDGVPMTDEQIDDLNRNHGDFVLDCVYKWLW